MGTSKFKMFFFLPFFCTIAVIFANPVQELNPSSIDFPTLGPFDEGLFSDSNVENDKNPVDSIELESYAPNSDSPVFLSDDLAGTSDGCGVLKLRARDDIDEETVADGSRSICPIRVQPTDSNQAPAQRGSSKKEQAGQLMQSRPAPLALPQKKSDENCHDDYFRLRLCCTGLGKVAKDKSAKTWFFALVNDCAEGLSYF